MAESIESRIGALLEPAEEAPAPEPEKPEAVEADLPAEPVEAEETAEEPVEEPVAEESDDDAVQVESLNELAEHLGIEPADLYALKMGVTDPDGNKLDVSLGEWKDGFQSSKLYEKRMQELQSQRQEFESQRQQFEQEARQRVETTQKLLQAAEKQLIGEIERIDWQSLRDNDPAEYAARRQEYLERQRVLEEAKQGAVQEQSQFQREQEERFQQQRQQIRERERQALYQAIPEWRDAAKSEPERAAVASYLTGMGLTAEQLDNIDDHRVFVMARKAMLYDQTVKKADVAKKKVVKIGKNTLRPGSKPSKDDAKVDAVKAKRAKFRKSGGRDLGALASIIRDSL